MTETGLASVIIPLYNGGKYIAETVQSALCQSYRSTEVIVVDDGSSDAGPTIASQFPVRLISQANQGISGARNTGIRASRGEFIALLDQDDLFKPDKIEKQIAFLRSKPEYLMVYTPEERFGPNEPQRRISDRHRSRKMEGDIFTDIYRSNYISPGTTLIRKEAFEKAGLFDMKLAIAEEHDLFIRISYHGLVAFMNEPLLEYRWHGENTSSRLASIYPFVEFDLYQKYLPWLRERTHAWWWIYNKQCSKALRDMGIVSLKEKKVDQARRYLLASFFRSPSRYKTVRYLIQTLILSAVNRSHNTKP